MGPIKEILAESQFQEELTTSSQAKLVVVDFTASWCGPCQTIAPFYEQLSRKYPNAVFLKVDVDKCQETAVNQRVSVMPTFHFYRNKVKVDSMQGADPQKLEEKILKYYDEGIGENDVGVAGHCKEEGKVKKAVGGIGQDSLKVSSSNKNAQAKVLKVNSTSRLVAGPHSGACASTADPKVGVQPVVESAVEVVNMFNDKYPSYDLAQINVLSPSSSESKLSDPLANKVSPFIVPAAASAVKDVMKPSGKDVSQIPNEPGQRSSVDPRAAVRDQNKPGDPAGKSSSSSPFKQSPMHPSPQPQSPSVQKISQKEATPQDKSSSAPKSDIGSTAEGISKKVQSDKLDSPVKSDASNKPRDPTPQKK